MVKSFKQLQINVKLSILKRNSKIDIFKKSKTKKYFILLNNIYRTRLLNSLCSLYIQNQYFKKWILYLKLKRFERNVYQFLIRKTIFLIWKQKFSKHLTNDKQLLDQADQFSRNILFKHVFNYVKKRFFLFLYKINSKFKKLQKGNII